MSVFKNQNLRFSWYWIFFCLDPVPYRFCLDPDPYQSSVWIRIRNEFFSDSGSGSVWKWYESASLLIRIRTGIYVYLLNSDPYRFANLRIKRCLFSFYITRLLKDKFTRIFVILILYVDKFFVKLPGGPFPGIWIHSKDGPEILLKRWGYATLL